ncbi:TPA: restriction endonuclease subunit S [Proteus mirabilis]|nr:restriction endonuclease subunit S [Proteus mirabilis]HDU8343369.1 restriction endonuclease subunit S [Proteus mirabilis]
MGSEWPLVKLGEYCCKIGSGATPKGGSSVYLDAGDVCLIRSQNIYNDGFEEGGLVYIDEVAAAKLRNVIVEHNDILLNITGDSVARVCLVPDAYLPARVNQHVAIIRPNKEHFDARFLRYFLASPKTQILLLNLSSAGATRNALTKSMIENFEVPKPSLSVQVFIANILQILDDKIMKNRQINQTLEQMAQTLFKSWFVDFDPVVDNALDAGFFEQDLAFSDELLRRVEIRKAVRESDNFKPLSEDIRRLFPDAFEECAESTLGLGGWIPTSWTLSNVGAEFDVTMGQSPPGSTYNEIGIGLPFFQGKTDFGFRFPTNRVYCTAPKRMANKNDTLISVRAPVGDINLAAEDCAIGRGIAAARHKSGCISFTYYSMNSLSKYFEVFESEGTVFGSINQKDFKALLFIKYPFELINKFNFFCSEWDKRIDVQSIENIVLTKLRDTLLPKLISGDLSLSDIKIDIPEETLI